MSVYNKFADRVNHAARTIVNNGPFNRTFDTCFEMSDGDEVCKALIKRCKRNDKLRIALKNSQGLSYNYLVDNYGF